MGADSMERYIEIARDWLLLYGMRIVSAVVILVLGWLAARLVREVVRKLMRRAKVPEAAVSFVGSLTYVALMAFVVIAALGQLGIQTASFVAVLAAAGLAIGLALQGSLANFAGGFLIVVFQPIRVGDFVEAAGVSGVVEAIEIFTTTLKSPDNKKIIIPNAKLTGDNIINYSAKESRRIDMVFGIGYGDDIQKAQDVAMAVLRDDPRVLTDPEPVVLVVNLGDSSVDLGVRPWVKTADYWDVKFAVTKAIKQRFDAEGISIPFPQRDVHIYQAKPAS